MKYQRFRFNNAWWVTIIDVFGNVTVYFDDQETRDSFCDLLDLARDMEEVE